MVCSHLYFWVGFDFKFLVGLKAGQNKLTRFNSYILLDFLNQLGSSISAPWMLAGDFNQVLHYSKNLAPIRNILGPNASKDFITTNSLIDLNTFW